MRDLENMVETVNIMLANYIHHELQDRYSGRAFDDATINEMLAFSRNALQDLEQKKLISLKDIDLNIAQGDDGRVALWASISREYVSQDE